MDIFERKETIKFTQLLRVKLKNQRESTKGHIGSSKAITAIPAKPLEAVQMYERV